VKAAVLAEECGEVARAVLEVDMRGLRDELVQVAAVAVAWLEGMP
jgi:NTP pyrophosphatase (non-canonical NTP hydrolase)